MRLNQVAPDRDSKPVKETMGKSLRSMHRLRRLGVLIWKNTFLVRKLHWVVTLVEVLVPLVMFTLMAVIRANSSGFGDIVVDQTTWSQPIDQLSLRNTLRYKEVHFAPLNNFTKSLMNRAASLNIDHESMGHKSEVELLVHYSSLANDTYKTRNFVSVVFEGEAAAPNFNKVPKKLSYKLRFRDKFHTDKNFLDIVSGHEQFITPYKDSGFLGLQLVINKAFIEVARAHERNGPASPLLDQFTLQRMPYPPYNDDRGYSEVVKTMLPLVSMFSFMILCTTVVKRVVEEKQSGAKELMKLMGMENWAFWLSWMLDALFMRAISVGLIVWLLTMPFNQHVGAVLDHTSPTLLFFVLMVYCVSAITFLFAISAFFSRPVLAMSLSFIVWFLSLTLPSQYVNESNPGYYMKMLTMIFPNMGLFFTFNAALEFEKRGVGAQWNNIHETGNGLPRDVTLLNVLLMFVFDTFLYAIITWYVSAVHPGQYGYKQPYMFFLSKSYWLGEKEKETPIEDSQETEVENFERPLTNNLESRNVGIVIRNLVKTYPGVWGRQPVRAVRGVSLDIHQGEITVLLGHNGAGKTTTMSILTGMISPSSGIVKVLGDDLREDLTSIRQSLGLCPQHNLLFGELTVLQHLIFFAMLKGKSYKHAFEEAEDLLATVKLDKKKDAYAAQLSGGMKRKLSLAIALIGGSKVVMLDEPTSGLDPEARREIWDLLLHLRKQRTILLSTHFMEEADVLGDTIAIMAHGKVECCGSTMYLKRLYGAGYHLHLLRKNNCDMSKVHEIVKEHLPEAVPENSQQDQVDNVNCGGPISYTLPVSEVNNFPDLFDALEKSKADLGLESIGVSVTTLEEVFLRVGELTAEKLKDGLDEVDLSPTHTEGEENHDLTKNSGCQLFVERVQALLIKKVVVTKRQWIFLLLQVALPALLTLCAVLSSYAALNIDVNSEPDMLIGIEQYGSKSSLNVLYSVDASEAASLAKEYSSIVRSVAEPQQITKNIFSELIEVGKSNLAVYRTKYIAGALFNSTGNNTLNLVGLYGVDAIHAAPMSLDLLSNALLKHSTSSAYQIVTYNHPLPEESPTDHINSYFTIAAAISVIWLTIAHLGWMFATSFTLLLPLQERVLGCRQLQLMTGCPLVVIWFSYFLVDMLIICVVVVVTLVTIFPFDHLHIFTSSTELAVLFLIFLMYGLAGTSFAYFVSFLKDSMPAAFGFMVFVGIFIGGTVNLVVYALELFPNWAEWGTALRLVTGLLLPHSALISSLTHFSGTAVYNSACKNIPPMVKEFTCSQGALGNIYPASICCENICEKYGSCFEPLPYLSVNGQADSMDWIAAHGPIGREIIFLAIGAVFWFSLVLLLDSGVLGQAAELVLTYVDSKIRAPPQDEVDGRSGDEDVAIEADRAAECIKRSDKDDGISADGIIGDRTILAVSRLRKQYGLPLRKSRLRAVRDVSFRVQEGECFGLLGVNGAGKSTTFKMLTGAAPPSDGDATLGRRHLRAHRRHFLSNLGYCPQTDAHLGLLTGRETLRFYAQMRGVDQKQVEREVDKWVNGLGLREYEDRASSTYSGGNQRKLSAAMALIGEPPVALLDEPTSGVDPIARRQLWQALAACRRAGQSIVLTSHSMDECEALCSRLGIMVDGELKCVGPIGHLKSKFGQGFTLMVKVRSLSWNSAPEGWPETTRQLDNLKMAISNTLSPCKLIDEHLGLLHYHIMERDEAVKWSDLFKSMEAFKSEHSILEDYTLSETTLEQVFLSFAQHRNQQTASVPPSASPQGEMITHV